MAALLTSCAASGQPSASVPSSTAPSEVATASPSSSTDEPKSAEAILAECAESESTAEPIELSLRAENIAFDTDRLEAVACEPFRIVLDNADASAHHNFAIEVAGLGGARLFSGELTDAGQSATYEIPPLPAGEYRFLCEPHSAAMNGTLVVAASS